MQFHWFFIECVSLCIAVRWCEDDNDDDEDVDDDGDDDDDSEDDDYYDDVENWNTSVKMDLMLRKRFLLIIILFLFNEFINTEYGTPKSLEAAFILAIHKFLKLLFLFFLSLNAY